MKSELENIIRILTDLKTHYDSGNNTQEYCEILIKKINEIIDIYSDEFKQND